MKITPVKNYKKPHYAAALAAITAMGAVSGCVTGTPGIVDHAGDTTTTTELLIDGGVQLETDVTTTAIPEGTVVTEDDETTVEVTTTEAVEIDGGIVIPEDEEIPVVDDFSLAGDIAIAPDYEAEAEGMEYDTEYVNTFYDKNVPLMRWVYDDADWRTGMTLGEIPFVVSLQSTHDDFFISFYDSDNTDLLAEIENAGGIPFDYGYTVYASYKGGTRRLVFIDITKPHYDNIGKIADYLISEGFAFQYAEETADDPTKAVFQEFVTDGIAALPEDEIAKEDYYDEFTLAGDVAVVDEE